MALTQQEFQAWLDNSQAIKCILVEVVVNIANVETILYLSNRNYNTTATDTPANTNYLPIINNSTVFTQELSIDGEPSISWGDISLDNADGTRDSWLNYIWTNRSISIYIGDVNFSRNDFTKIFTGYVENITSSGIDTLNISIRDMLQKLNGPITDEIIGGSIPNSTELKPLLFGEVFNITPILIDPNNFTYMVHNGPIERIIEVRDNGVPLIEGINGYSVNLQQGTFTLAQPPVGTITCSAQGEKTIVNPVTGGLVNHLAYTGRTVNWTRSGNNILITDPNHQFIRGSEISVTTSTDLTALPAGVYAITATTSQNYTIIANNAGTISGNVRISPYADTIPGIIKLICLKYGPTPLTPEELDLPSFGNYVQNVAGIYLTEVSNVIEVCQDLANSIGAQFTSTMEGKITLKRLTEPTAGSINISSDYIVENSLEVSERVPVKGSIRLGYCKNWTPQTNLLTGIPEDHKILLSNEYLFVQAIDNEVVARYNLSEDSSSKDTHLISNIIPNYYATQEAYRLLNLWKVPRTIYTMEVTSKYLLLNVGDMVSIDSNRYGFSNTPAQVISTQKNWSTGSVSIGILV